MEQLRFTAVHEDGRHLVLTDPGDGEEYLLEIDERLRDAVRGRRTGLAEHPAAALTPRTVQAMMRAGESAEEVAAATGWPVERVRRYEAPILAEREHVASLAQQCEVRGRAADGTERPTLASRVRERLTVRGVDPELARWDASRPEGGSWTVLVGFVAANRERRAAWRFDPAARHLEALDDEARWLSEDEQALPGGAGGYAGLGGDGAGAVDLVATMRRRSRARGRRRGRAGAAAEDPAAVPGREEVPEDLLPLEDLRYDPATHGLPPAAHGRPEAEDGAEDGADTGATEAGQRAEGPREDFAADAPAEMSRPDEISEAPDPDSEGEQDAAEEESEEESEEDRSPQEATLDDFFGEDSEEEDQREDPDHMELEGDLEPEPEPEPGHETEHETERGRDGQPEQAEDDEAEVAGVSDRDAEDGAAPTLVAVDDQEDVEDDHADTGGSSAAGSADRSAGSGRRGGSRRKGRPSVPSWDDIMFGARDQR